MHEYVNVLKHNLYFSLIALIPIIITCIIGYFVMFNNTNKGNGDTEYNNSESVIVEEQDGSIVEEEWTK